MATKAETPETLPEEPSDEIEVALVGRSNVGKSSLLNALANSYGERTARTSDRPGETQAVTFYRVGKTFRLVDLPGYGFAFADEAKSNEMSAVMRAYLQQRKALKHVVLLIDARHGFKATDTEMAQWLHKNCAAKLHVCLTKCDTIEPDQLKRIASMTKDDAAKFTKEPLLLVSALKKQGIDVLRREIARFAVPSVYRKLILRFQRRENASLGNDSTDADADAAVAADDALGEELIRKKEEKRDRYRVHVAPSKPDDDDVDDDADFDDMLATQESEVRQAMQSREKQAPARPASSSASAAPARSASAPPPYRRFEGGAGERRDSKFDNDRRGGRGDNDKRRHSYDGGDKPRRFDGGRRFDDDKPRRFDGDKPRRFDGDKPRRFDSDKPRQFDGDKPRRFDNDKPRRFDNDKPRRFDGEKPQAPGVDIRKMARAGELLPSRFDKSLGGGERPNPFAGNKRRRFGDGERRFDSDKPRQFGGERRFGGGDKSGERRSFPPRREGSGGFPPRGDRFGGGDKSGERRSFTPRREGSGGFPPRREGSGGFSPRGNRFGGDKPRRVESGGDSQRRGGSFGARRESRDDRPRRSLSAPPLSFPPKREEVRAMPRGGSFASFPSSGTSDQPSERSRSAGPPPGGRRGGDPRLARKAFRERNGNAKGRT